MWKRLLLLAVVAWVTLGFAPDAPPSDAHAEEADGCPCDDDGGPDDGCCASASCACASVAPTALPPRVALPAPRRLVDPDADWCVSAEQRARDRTTAPPTRPPIG
jgi:hypothetical protein